MRKLLVGLLAFGSLSVFAQDGQFNVGSSNFHDFSQFGPKAEFFKKLRDGDASELAVSGATLNIRVDKKLSGKQFRKGHGEFRVISCDSESINAEAYWAYPGKSYANGQVRSTLLQEIIPPKFKYRTLDMNFDLSTVVPSVCREAKILKIMGKELLI